MKVTPKDVVWACGLLSIIIVIVSSVVTLGAAVLGNVITDDIINGKIQIIDTSTGKPIKVEFTDEMKKQYGSLSPIIKNYPIISFVGLILLSFYTIIFTKFDMSLLRKKPK